MRYMIMIAMIFVPLNAIQAQQKSPDISAIIERMQPDRDMHFLSEFAPIVQLWIFENRRQDLQDLYAAVLAEIRVKDLPPGSIRIRQAEWLVELVKDLTFLAFPEQLALASDILDKQLAIIQPTERDAIEMAHLAHQLANANMPLRATTMLDKLYQAAWPETPESLRNLEEFLRVLAETRLVLNMPPIDNSMLLLAKEPGPVTGNQITRLLETWQVDIDIANRDNAEIDTNWRLAFLHDFLPNTGLDRVQIRRPIIPHVIPDRQSFVWTVSQMARAIYLEQGDVASTRYLQPLLGKMTKDRRFTVQEDGEMQAAFFGQIWLTTYQIDCAACRTSITDIWARQRDTIDHRHALLDHHLQVLDMAAMAEDQGVVQDILPDILQFARTRPDDKIFGDYAYFPTRGAVLLHSCNILRHRQTMPVEQIGEWMATLSVTDPDAMQELVPHCGYPESSLQQEASDVPH